MGNDVKKTVLEGKFEDVVSIADHYYLISKKNRIAVLTYTISSKGLLDKIGVVYDHNYVEDKDYFTLINGYISSDDNTDLVCANRLMFEVIGSNLTQGTKWSYLGSIYCSLSSDSPIKLYAADITDIEIKEEESVEDKKERNMFKMLDASKVLQTDDMILLAGYNRLFQNFFVSSLSKKD
jgi:hypothetical protein